VLNRSAQVLPARHSAPIMSAVSAAEVPARCARAACRGAITPKALREVEDRAIREIVKFQQDLGCMASPTANSAAPGSTSIFWRSWRASSNRA